MLWGIPITTIVGALSGFIFKLFAQRTEMQASERKHTLDLLAARADDRSRHVEDEVKLLQARAEFEERVHVTDPHRSMTRRILTYMITIGFFLIPMYLIVGGVPFVEVFDYDMTSGGFFGLFESTKRIIDVVTLNGIPIEFLTSFAAAFEIMIGFYFGTSTAKMMNPYRK